MLKRNLFTRISQLLYAKDERTSFISKQKYQEGQIVIFADQGDELQIGKIRGVGRDYARSCVQYAYLISTHDETVRIDQNDIQEVLIRPSSIAIGLRVGLWPWAREIRIKTRFSKTTERDGVKAVDTTYENGIEHSRNPCVAISELGSTDICRHVRGRTVEFD
ncbi:hypothetical protein M422DRAFT_784352 [Sphaerobolus stellatus SS14]|uniref:Uncharacterized protein n=1 Tax=Sphaerobolus stellatus (strain SS14) TaxID=990650 RepID=A0A0C9U4L5_SPHS4|nr:hypothetical protein M422DRAFT_784352 [Sphaerobolus stellatus SS14]